MIGACPDDTRLGCRHRYQYERPVGRSGQKPRRQEAPALRRQRPVSDCLVRCSRRVGSRARPASRGTPLPPPVTPGPRRHGLGLACRRRGAASTCRAQAGPPDRPGVRGDAHGSVDVGPQRGSGRRACRPCRSRQDLRCRRGRPLSVDRHGVAVGTNAGRSGDCGRAAAGPPGDKSRPVPSRRAAGHAPRRHGAPRRQAGQRVPVRRRAGGPDRLRHRVQHR